MRALLLIIALALLISCAQKPPHTEIPVTDGEVRVDVSGIKEAVPLFFSAHIEGRRYDFFIQSMDGEVAAYVDACLKCAPQKKGFRVEDDRLTCNACGESFPLDELSGIGSCHPIPLPGELKGTTFTIKVPDLVRKCRYPI